MGDTGIATDILEAIEEAMDIVGHSMTLKSVAGSVLIDAAQPSLGKTKVTTNYPVTGEMIDFQEEEIDGINVQIGDRKAIISINGLAVTITTRDLLVDGSETWKIIRVGTPTFAGVNVTQILHLRL